MHPKRARELMKRVARRQLNNEGQALAPGRDKGRDKSGPYMRSPAMESAEQRRDVGPQSIAPRKRAKSQGHDRSKSPIRHAADATLTNPGMPRKSLPRLGAKQTPASPRTANTQLDHQPPALPPN